MGMPHLIVHLAALHDIWRCPKAALDRAVTPESPRTRVRVEILQNRDGGRARSSNRQLPMRVIFAMGTVSGESSLVDESATPL